MNDGAWSEASLGQLGEFRNGANFNRTDFGVGLPIINVKNLFDGRFASIVDLDEIERSAISDPMSLAVKQGDILFARSSVKASGAGQVAMVKDHPPSAIFSGFIIRFRITAKDRIDASFLNYLLRSPKYRELLPRIASGTTIINLSQDSLSRLPILLPPLSEQLAIAQVLGTLDDKIELNQRMNGTLEAMGEAVFKSWFIDLASPHANKERGNTLGVLSSAAIFPDGFKNSEFGDIPTGWSVRSVYDCATFINGVAFSKVHFSTDASGLPIVKIAELKDGVTGQTKFTKEELAEKYKIRDGDILFSWSGSPDTSIDTFVWAGGGGWLNQHIFKVESRSAQEKLFVYYLLKYLKPTFIEIARDKQTTGLGHVTAQDLKRLKVAFPSTAVLEEFQRIVEPLFKRSFETLTESRTLVALRDALLPKLLSGQVRIKNLNSVGGLS